jgi:hypothetical protein
VIGFQPALLTDAIEKPIEHMLAGYPAAVREIETEMATERGGQRVTIAAPEGGAAGSVREEEPIDG